MAGVLKRTSNSVEVRITASDSYTDWQNITVGGSVIFQWKVSQRPNSSYMNYYINFTKKIPSDKVNYVVTYTHWEVMSEIGSAVMYVRTEHSGVTMYCPCFFRNSKVVNVEISTDQSSPCAILYDDAELTDFMLSGKGGSIPFHKVVLAAHSSVFKKMLAGEWKETAEGVLDLADTSKEMVEHLKKYMYLGKLPEKQNEQVHCFKQLLLLSLCYLMEDLKLRCIKELRFLLNPENVTDLTQFALEYSINGLFVEILDCTAMGDLNPDEVRKLLVPEDAPTSKE